MEGLNQKLDLKELSTHNDKTIAQKLKQDLENLTWMIQRKEMKHDQDDDALLMVLTFYLIKIKQICIKFNLNAKTLMSKPDHKGRMKEIKKKMKIIDDRYKKFMDDIKIPLEKGEYAQPSTFETNFFNNVIILFKFFIF
jgi:hypothetical protein